jgi:hypothetical protein
VSGAAAAVTQGDLRRPDPAEVHTPPAATAGAALWLPRGGLATADQQPQPRAAAVATTPASSAAPHTRAAAAPPPVAGLQREAAQPLRPASAHTCDADRGIADAHPVDPSGGDGRPAEAPPAAAASHTRTCLHRSVRVTPNIRSQGCPPTLPTSVSPRIFVPENTAPDFWGRNPAAYQSSA